MPIIVFNVTPTRETPVAGADGVDLFERYGSVGFTVAATCCLNDRDDDGTRWRITRFRTPRTARLELIPGVVTLGPPGRDHPMVTGGTMGGRAGDGSAAARLDERSIPPPGCFMRPMCRWTSGRDLFDRFTSSDPPGPAPRACGDPCAWTQCRRQPAFYTPDCGFAGEDVLALHAGGWAARASTTRHGAADVASLLDPPTA